MKRNRVAVWLDVREEGDVVHWIKYDVPVKERGEVVRKALELYRSRKLSEVRKAESIQEVSELETQVSHLKRENEVLKQELTSLKQMIDDNTVIIGQAVLSQLELVFPDREIDDALIQTILIRGIRSLKKEEEEREKADLIKSLREV